MKINFKKANSKNMIPLSKYGILRTYLTIPFRLKGIKVLYPFLGTVIKRFFWLQFSVKWSIRKQKVVKVDHTLDAIVPFTPKKVSIYLDFVNFWIRPMTFLFCRFGVKKALPYCCEYLIYIKKAYFEASRVYSTIMSTTNRPNYTKMKEFKTIHRLDPHLMCVPSLHVAICALAFSFYKTTFKEIGLTQEEQDFYNQELYISAISITETVLFVKQHSVNCIPAALYMMKHLIPQYFSIQDGVNFIDNLFSGLSDTKESPYYNEDLKSIDLVSIKNREEIRAHIHFMFEKLTLEDISEENWTIPILNWLKSMPSI